jgi:adenylate cyclase class 2
MSSTGGTHLETEVKLAVPDPATILSRLAAGGFTVATPRVFEANTLYDTPVAALRSRGALLRIRQAGDVFTVTYKGPKLDSQRYKVQPETEFQVSDRRAADQLFVELGYRPSFRYERFRTVHLLPDDPRGTAALDETPVGMFLELEGPAEWIDSAAQRLGYTPAEYITSTYVDIYVEHCNRHGVPPADLVFPQGKAGT